MMLIGALIVAVCVIACGVFIMLVCSGPSMNFATVHSRPTDTVEPTTIAIKGYRRLDAEERKETGGEEK